MLSKNVINIFKDMHKKDTGETLTSLQAYKKGMKLINLVKSSLKKEAKK